MSKAGTFMEQLNSVDFSTLLVEAIKNSQSYKSPQTFLFVQQETQKSVYVSFFSVERMGVYAITEMENTVTRLYEVSLDGDRVNFALLTECHDKTIHPTIDTLLSEKRQFKMEKIDPSDLSSDELKFALGNLNRKAEDIVLDYAKYMLKKEEVTTESTRRKLEAKLEDFYSNTKCPEREIDEVISDFLDNCGFRQSSNQVNFVSRYGREITKVIICKKDNEKVVFLVSYTITQEGHFYDFIVNTVNSHMEITGDGYYTSSLDKEFYNILKCVVTDEN